MRAQDEIVTRIEFLSVTEDILGFRKEVLVTALDLQHARPFIKRSITATKWARMAVPAEETEQVARNYYSFAVAEIEDHRGISASRSVEKLTEYAWLLGNDELVDSMAALDYPQYGAPIVKAWGHAFGEPWPDKPWAIRMAAGLPCVDGCVEGCSQ